jgi:4-amino-4-deoxy-L-arabinose transferase-like glycosyltransferase
MAGRLWDRRSAYIAAMVCATSFLPVAGATFLSTDMLLVLWETLAVAGYLSWALKERNRPAAFLWVMWIGFGLAFLTKGPPGMLPLTAIIPWHIWRFRNAAIFHPVGLILFDALAFSWYGFILWRHPDLTSLLYS